ncbi:hypothetical protein TIFTF001_028649 [Ficus carica]|uniref:Uncharacterized protein n=1 Tax=Ficus carica TaxID=3494 RepID=A0AA88DQS3_FICCA|nr:hypothetical protein TIFTF001_028649 [Ficus carica]
MAKVAGESKRYDIVVGRGLLEPNLAAPYRDPSPATVAASKLFSDGVSSSCFRFRVVVDCSLDPVAPSRCHRHRCCIEVVRQRWMAC